MILIYEADLDILKKVNFLGQGMTADRHTEATGRITGTAFAGGNYKL